MGKQEQIAIAESNLWNFGSDLEREVKQAAAECESAWDGAGQSEGTRVWRVEKFKIVDWPKEQFGKFYNGDSYIVLNTHQDSANSPLKHDIHFWLGESTSQDEAGTAAYKTVELDDRLGGGPVQHREVQDHESDLFLDYFPGNTIEILEGGIESGFNIVEPQKFHPRLLHVKGTRKRVRVVQVPLTYKSLNSGDCFILDLGMEILQWNGKDCGIFEKMKSGEVARATRSERGGKPTLEIFAEGEDCPGLKRFWEALGGEGKIKSAEEGGCDREAAEVSHDHVKLFRLSDQCGKISFTLEKTGKVSKSDLDSQDAFILDNGAEIFAWIGKNASDNERKLAMKYAQQYLKDFNRPAYLPISRVVEGGENIVFESQFS